MLYYSPLLKGTEKKGLGIYYYEYVLGPSFACHYACHRMLLPR